MIAAITIAVAAVFIVGLALCGIGLLLAKRVVSVAAQQKTLSVSFDDHSVQLPADERTTAAGEFLLYLPDNGIVRVGDVLEEVAGRVRRRLLGERVNLPSGEVDVLWSAHRFAGPGEVATYSTVSFPLSDGEEREAWLFRGDPTHWVIHVQGVRTTRGVTLRTVAVACEAGATSLAITYRGAGDGPAARSATLGSREWTELRDAIRFAQANGATRVSVVAWSMGAALAFELLRREPEIIDDLVLICPVSSWPATIEYGAVRAGLPRQAALLAGLQLRSRIGARLLGMPTTVDVRTLQWTAPGTLPVPTLIIHSQGDEVVPWATTVALATNNSCAELVEIDPCPHGYELTATDPATHDRLLRALC